MDEKLHSKLQGVERRHAELSAQLSDPEVVGNRNAYREASQAFAEVEPVVSAYREFCGYEQQLGEAREMLESSDDAELRALATDEVQSLEQQCAELEERMKQLLLPSDPNDAKNVVLEIRAGTGGDEATLFAAEMFRMYSRLAERQGWKISTTDVSESAVGGVKEVIGLIEGERVYSRLKFESGVHRVQRVPQTETQGRVHTSAVTVAVLPEADDVEVVLDEKELRVDTFCSSGPGGQSVNTTQSAVRITHIPTNTVVQCQDEKSWHKNKARALQVLRSRIYDRMLQQQHDEIAQERRGLVGSGDRSEKIRTYNFPQNRVTDHRIGLTQHNLDGVLDGQLASILDALSAHDQAERLRAEAS